jgi:hypothetical protein
MRTGEFLPDQCIYCHQPLEIAAVSFPLLKPCRALFVCTSCGLSFAEGDRERGHETGRRKPLEAFMSWVQNARR